MMKAPNAGKVPGTQHRRLTLLTAIGLLGAFGWLVPHETLAAPADYQRPELRIPKDSTLTPERIALGKALFFDPRLSGSNWISCATCHNPALGWSDGLPTAIGHNMQVLGRATPTILNTAYNKKQFWDGRSPTLEHQALGPIEAAGEMNQTLAELIPELKAIPGYELMFERAYPQEGITDKTIAKAIAAFERTIVSTEAPFDRWVSGDESAISDAAKRGFALFEGKANCAACHQKFNFVDDGFHNIGLPSTDDPGRYVLVKVDVLQGAFKTPTLRDITRTAPYMHNGVYATLAEVIDHYDVGGVNKSNLDPNMKPLRLTASEKKDLTEFLKALTGAPLEITVPNLPSAF
ncbi:MAG: cytochrome c peroxidase [Gammaproteobacteria bacterium]|nr:MAG: cytochrome c peroxidase [Gammaproteobacteria bacterium]TND05815.1 MAG: cytochrome c peroxidase [Gammaproteobacteria bacterium]